MSKYSSLLPQFITWYNRVNNDNMSVDSPLLMMVLCSSLDTWFEWTDDEGVTPSPTDTDWSEGVFTYEDGLYLSKYIYDYNQGG